MAVLVQWVRSPVRWRGAILRGLAVLPLCLLCLPRGQAATWAVAAAAAVLLGWLGIWGPVIDRALRRAPLQRELLFLVGGLTVACLLIGGNVFAGWWIQDDHEIAQWLGPDGRMSLGELSERLASHQEVGRIGSFARVRPGYYLIRHLEAYLWGDRPGVWYAARVAMLGGSLALAWHCLWKKFGGVDAGLILLYLLGWPFWSDIWCRIGASEAYAMVGVAIYLAGWRLVLAAVPADRPAVPSWLGWSVLVLGAAIALGSKENFLILLPATWALLFWLWRQDRLDRTAVAAAGTLTAAAVALAVVIVWAVAANGGKDIYARPVGLAGVFTSARRCVRSGCGLALTASLLATVVLSARARRWPRWSWLRPRLRTAGWWFGGLWLLFVSQYVFYSGWKSDCRYAFPASLAPLLAVPLGVQLALDAWRLNGPWRRWRRPLQAVARIVLIVWVAGACVTMQQHTRQHVRLTRDFNQRLEAIELRARQDPQRPIVFVTHVPWDFEPLFAVARFLRANAVANPIFLRLQDYPADATRSPLGAMLTEQLSRIIERGEGDFAPSSRLPAQSLCLGVGFSGVVPPDLEDLGVVYPLAAD